MISATILTLISLFLPHSLSFSLTLSLTLSISYSFHSLISPSLFLYFREEVELFCIDHLVMVDIVALEEALIFDFQTVTTPGPGGKVTGLEAVMQVLHIILTDFSYEDDAFQRAKQVRHYTSLYCTVLCCTMLYCAALCFTVLHYALLCCTMLYCTAPYSTELYCTALRVQY